MINIGKHEKLPDLYFRSKAKKQREVTPDVSATANPHTSGSSPSEANSVPQATGVIPGKRISMHIQLLTQMELWHSLLERWHHTRAVR